MSIVLASILVASGGLLSLLAGLVLLLVDRRRRPFPLLREFRTTTVARGLGNSLAVGGGTLVVVAGVSLLLHAFASDVPEPLTGGLQYGVLILASAGWLYANTTAATRAVRQSRSARQLDTETDR